MQRYLLYFLFFLSGFSGLGYEILWTRMLSVSLGHEIISVLAVISAFFIGLALGAWFLDRLVSLSTAPGYWYVLFETVIGVWALVLPFILPDLNGFVTGLVGVAPTPFRHWSISFLYPLFVLLPATVAMGGTLPAMDRFLEQFGGDRRSVAGLYSINTFGAVAGILMVTFAAMPSLGLNKSSFLLASINFIGAAGIFILARGKDRVRKAGQEPTVLSVGTLQRYLILFVTGLLGIGFEVLMVRALSQILENTIFSFAALLIIFLFGTAAGAGIYQKYQRSLNVEHTLSFMLLLTAFFCLVSIFLLRYVEPLFQVLQKGLGKGFREAIAAEMLICMLFFLLPTASMGATFSHLAQSLRRNDRGVGRALCLNTFGGAFAPLVFGVFLLPTMGIKYTLLVVPIVYMLCMPKFRRSYVTPSVLVAATTLFVVLNPHPYPFVSLSEDDDTIVHYKEGVMASVSVVKDNRDELHLKVNHRFQMGGTTSVFSDRRQAYLPLLLHPKPRQALFLGLGAGTTFAGAAHFPELEAVGVELLPEVIEAVPYFEKATGNFEDYDHLRIVNADARRYVTAAAQKYDVVIADLFHPARDGAGSLYTMEHFQAVRELLSDNGLFCQWLPLYQLDLEMFKVITNTFLQVFPDGQAYLAHYSIDQPIIGLVGGKRQLTFPENWYRKRVQGKNFRRHMTGFGYDSIYSLLGTFVAGNNVLREFVGDSPVNTDDNPVVLFQAPRFVYGNPGPAHERLSTLLAACSPPDPETILAEEITEEDHIARSRLSAYWSARDSFLSLGTRVERTGNLIHLYEKASGPLLEVVRKSVDFSAAYFPLISIAYDLYPYDRDASYQLLRKLERANPLRPEAGILRQRLFADQSLP